jgi:hypothetical protein
MGRLVGAFVMLSLIDNLTFIHMCAAMPVHLHNVDDMVQKAMMQQSGSEEADRQHRKHMWEAQHEDIYKSWQQQFGPKPQQQQRQRQQQLGGGSRRRFREENSGRQQGARNLLEPAAQRQRVHAVGARGGGANAGAHADGRTGLRAQRGGQTARGGRGANQPVVWQPGRARWNGNRAAAGRRGSAGPRRGGQRAGARGGGGGFHGGQDVGVAAGAGGRGSTSRNRRPAGRGGQWQIPIDAFVFMERN